MTLISSMDEFRAINPVSNALKLDIIQPFIDNVEQEFIADILGDTELANIQTQYDDAGGGSVTGSASAIIGKIQKAVVWLSTLQWVDIGNIHTTPAGFQVTVTDKMAPASQWRVEAYKHECAKNGYKALQDLLIYLWSTSGVFSDWEASDEHDRHRALFVLNGKDIQSWVDIGNSYEIYCNLKPYIKTAMQFHVRPIVGQELYDDLVSENQANDVSDDNAILLEKILPVCVFNALHDGLPRLSVIFNRYGIIEKSTAEGRDATDINKPAGNDKLISLRREWQQNAILFENELRQYLKDNADTYALYADSDAFESTDTDDDDGDNINDQDRSVFLM